MKYIPSVFVCLIFTIINCFGQSGSRISGVIKDSLTQKPIANVNILLLVSEHDSLRTVTNNTGMFFLGEVRSISPKLIITKVGYSSLQVSLTLKPGENQLSFLMSEKQNTLKDVVVYSSKRLITQQTDRLIYDVRNDPDRKNLSAIEMMRKVPLLSVDADDQVKIKGQSNLRYLINGKPSAILDRKANDYLKGLRALRVSKIEVITIPPANYESEGLVGIINIITDSKTVDGFEGSISASSNVFSDQTSHSGTGTFDLKAGKLGISIFAGTGVEKPKQDISLQQISTVLPASRLTQSQDDRFKSPYTYGSVEINYQLDTLNLVTAQFNIFDAGNKIKGHTSTTFEQNPLPASIFEITRMSEENYQTINYSVNYEKGFKRSKKDFLTIAYRFNYFPDKLNDANLFSNQINSNRSNFYQVNDQKAVEHTIQTDYIFSARKLLINFGGKVIFRTNKSTYQQLSSNELINYFKNTQNVFSLYNSNSFKLGKWSVKAGARLESTVIDASSSASNEPIAFNTLNVSPSVAIQSPTKNQRSFSLGYTQRLSRPKLSEVNTFVDRSNPYLQTTGNFALRPSVGHNFQVSYSKFTANSLVVGLSYSIQKNIVQRISVYDNQTGVASARYENLGRDEAIGLNFYYKSVIGKNLSIDFNSNTSQVWISGYVESALVRNKRITTSMSTSPSLNLKKGYRLLGNFTYDLPRVTLQQVSNHNISSYIGLSKGLLSNNLNISLFAYNPIQRYRTIVRELTGNDFTQTSNIELYYRKFTIKAAYNFGKLTNRIRKVKKTIYNDDIQ